MLPGYCLNKIFNECLNASSKNFKSSDTWDAEHFTYFPYVDGFICDKNTYEIGKQAIKLLDRKSRGWLLDKGMFVSDAGANLDKILELLGYFENSDLVGV